MSAARLLRIPVSYDLARAPQLVTVATTHAALVAIQLALCTADELAARLDDDAAALEGDLDDDDLLPF